MKQNLNETLAFLNEHGFATEKQLPNETTAMTAPEYVLGNEVINALKKYVSYLKEKIQEDHEYEEVGRKIIAAVEAIINSDDLLDKGMFAFLNASGFWEKYNKAWKEYHESKRV